MSPVVCPEGHRSESTDYCDVCGSPIAAAAPAAPPSPAAAPASGPARPAVPCPHCGTPAAADALFCENCGYDFTTGAAPEPSRRSPLTAPIPVVPPPGAAAAPGEEPVAAARTGAAPGAEGEVATAAGPAGPAAPAPEAGAEGSSAGAAEESSQPPAAEAEAPPAAPVPSSLEVPPPAGTETWVAEVWVDPDWYDAQQPEDPMPSAGPPVLVPLTARSVLVGRHSVSRGIHPQIDCGADSAVSRRHCQLNTDGQRWWVEDLQSANGTYLSRAGDPVPTDPIPVGQRHEIQDGDRVYLGAWTRLVVRRALPGEV